MLFTDIHIQNYRSYAEASFELGPGVNIVVGPNAAGKTNLLEAIMVAAVGKAFRAKDAVLIRSGESWLRLDVHTSENQTRVVKIKLDPISGRADKTYEIDEKPYKRLGVNIKQPVVLFQPDDLQLLHAEPSARRDYMDELLEQYEPGYGSLRANYRRVVAQRNALLKQPSFGDSQLFAWNLRLSDLASQVIEKRLELIEQINTRINELYTAISGKNMKVKLEYSSKTDPDHYSDQLMKQLKSQEVIDKARGFTSRGPHRDDIVSYFGSGLLSDSASRGENRTFMLALKIIELQVLEERTGKRPLLLLDDVFSELDGARRRALTNFLQDYQTIITTTDADIITQHFSDRSHKIII